MSCSWCVPSCCLSGLLALLALRGSGARALSFSPNPRFLGLDVPLKRNDRFPGDRAVVVLSDRSEPRCEVLGCLHEHDLVAGFPFLGRHLHWSPLSRKEAGAGNSPFKLV